MDFKKKKIEDKSLTKIALVDLLSTSNFWSFIFFSYHCFIEGKKKFYFHFPDSICISENFGIGGAGRAPQTAV